MTDQAIAPIATVGRTEIISLAEEARGYADQAMAGNTRRAYAADWRSFSSWCASVDQTALPAAAATLALYLTARAPKLTVSTLARHLAAIHKAHRLAGHAEPSSPELELVWNGIKRRHGRPPRRKRGLVTEDLKKVVKRLPNSLAGQRDRALLLVGFAGALRRSELALLAMPADAADPAVVRCEFVSEGLEIHIGRAKGDQLGHGAVVAIPFGKSICPVAALSAWLQAAGITAGPVWRAIDRHGRLGEMAIGEKAMARIVKRACKGAGFDPAHFAGHSLRRGLITSANRGGASLEMLMRQARHKRVDTTMIYIEADERFRKNAAGKAGL